MLAGQGSNGFDGLKLLRQIRSVRPEPKIILTGEPDPQRIFRAIRQRAFSYFHRPLSAGPLVDMVQHALDADRVAGRYSRDQRASGVDHAGGPLQDRGGRPHHAFPARDDVRTCRRRSARMWPARSANC